MREKDERQSGELNKKIDVWSYCIFYKYYVYVFLCLFYDFVFILFMYNKLVDEIHSTFGLGRDDSESIIGRWVSDRYQLEVINTVYGGKVVADIKLAIDTN